MTDQVDNTLAEQPADPAVVAQDAPAPEIAAEVAADPAAAPDPSAAPQDPIVADPALSTAAETASTAETPTADAPDAAAISEEPIAAIHEQEDAPVSAGATRHAKHGVQTGPADHPRHQHTHRHA
jgi:hypothetical protein